MNSFLENNRSWLKPTIYLVYLAILLIPGYVFFSQRGGLSALQSNDFKTFAALAFPLFGLYAFTLIWMQTIIGMNMFSFTRLFGNAVAFHRTQGLFALLFASTHALAIPYIFGLEQYIGYNFLPDNLRIFAYFGATALFLLFLTIPAALLRKARPMRKFWRNIHYLNYAVFLLILVHSRNLGSDTQGTILEPLWNFFLITFLLSFGLRLFRAFNTKKIVVQNSV